MTVKDRFSSLDHPDCLEYLLLKLWNHSFLPFYLFYLRGKSDHTLCEVIIHWWYQLQDLRQLVVVFKAQLVSQMLKQCIDSFMRLFGLAEQSSMLEVSYQGELGAYQKWILFDLAIIK